MSIRHYSDYINVPADYKANMTREVINETPDTWLDFYPHIKYVDFLNTLITTINGGSKSIWLTGNYGTGKSNASLVAQKLFMDDEKRVNRWFNECKSKIENCETLKKNLFARRHEGTLVVYDYNSAGVGANEDFLVRLERSIVSALNERGMVVPPKSNLDAVVERLREEGELFFAARDEIQSELQYLRPEIKNAKQLIKELTKEQKGTDAPNDLLGDVQKVLHKRSIFLDISVPNFKKWIEDILLANNYSRIVYIFDEFHPFIEAHKENLKTFEDVAENPGLSNFYFLPVTHMTMEAYFGESSSSAKKSNDRFYFRNLQMPNDTAFQLAASAMKPVQGNEEEWKREKEILWESVKDISSTYFTSDQTDAGYVSRESFFNILPIHPMTAFLLKFLSESARSNQRSIFEYLKGSADGQEFQDFIREGGPEIESKQFLTADYLWKYFMERDDLGQSKEILAIRAEFERIKNREFQNKEDDDEDIRVLKAVLLFCLLSRLNPDGHERLRPTITNIKLSFKGDGAIVNVDSVIRSLAEKHCFSVSGDNIELYATSVGNADLQKKKSEYEDSFYDLLHTKTEEKLKEHKRGDFSCFSASRFDLRVSDVKHTTLTYLPAQTREKYSSGQNKDTGAVCLWFVVVKNKKEQTMVRESVEKILNQLRDHRIIFFTFPNLTFCDNNTNLWEDYIEQFAKYSLENDSTAKEQCKNAYERIESEWFSRLKSANTPLRAYYISNNNMVENDTYWSNFRDIITDYVRITLPFCLDLLTSQKTVFDNKGLKAWASAGIQYDAASGQFKQLVESFKKQNITADEDWFAANPMHPIVKIRALLYKNIDATVGAGGQFSLRKAYIELQRAPYGMKWNALSSFVLGVALRSILDRGYQWDNLQKTGVLDADILASIIESVVKDDGQNRIKGEQLICKLSREEKTFIENASKMFGITYSTPDDRVEDSLLRIQNRLEEVSNRVPLWMLPEYIYSVDEPLADQIKKVVDNICKACSISSKSGKTDDRINAVKEVGKIIQDNNRIVDVVASYIKPENFVTAFNMYVDSKSPIIVELAAEVGDVSHEYCNSIKRRAVETSSYLWKETDISEEISATECEYEVIKMLKPIIGFNDFRTYKAVMESLIGAIKSVNKLPKALITTAYPTLLDLLTAIDNNSNVRDIKDSLEGNSDIIKGLFFDGKKTLSIAILKDRLQGIKISDSVLRHVYNNLPAGYSQDENSFLEVVTSKIESNAKESVSGNIMEQWKRLTNSESPYKWSLDNGIPARFALFSDEAELIVQTVEFPFNFSSEKLGDVLNKMMCLEPTTIGNSQKRFIEHIVPQRFSKFNISLVPLLDYLKGKYGSEPNKWPDKPDISDFIKTQYKGEFAPQVTEKLKSKPAEEIKKRLLILARDNPELGLLFWEW